MDISFESLFGGPLGEFEFSFCHPASLYEDPNELNDPKCDPNQVVVVVRERRKRMTFLPLPLPLPLPLLHLHPLPLLLQ
jgi:hypothetical protein